MSAHASLFFSNRESVCVCFPPHLPLLIKGHDHHSSSVALHSGSSEQELLLSFLQTDTVHYTLPLTALQTRLNHREAGGVNTQRNLERVQISLMLVFNTFILERFKWKSITEADGLSCKEVEMKKTKMEKARSLYSLDPDTKPNVNQIIGCLVRYFSLDQLTLSSSEPHWQHALRTRTLMLSPLVVNFCTLHDT